MSTIKDSKLSIVGKDEVNWAQRQMQVLEDIKLDFEKRKPLEGLNIGACMHVSSQRGTETKGTPSNSMPQWRNTALPAGYIYVRI